MWATQAKTAEWKGERGQHGFDGLVLHMHSMIVALVSYMQGKKQNDMQSAVTLTTAST